MLKCHDMQWRIPPSHGVGTTSHQMARQLTDPPSVRRRCSRGEFFVLVRWSHQFTESISSAIETYLIFTFVSLPPLTSVGRSTSTNPVHMPGFVDIHNRAKWMWIVDVIGTWTDSTEFSVYPNMEVENTIRFSTQWAASLRRSVTFTAFTHIAILKFQLFYLNCWLIYCLSSVHWL